MKNLLISIFCLFLFFKPVFAEVPSAEQEDLKERVQMLFGRLDFQSLDQLAEELRSNKKKFNDGSLYLDLFYETLKFDFDQDAKNIQKFSTWIKLNPDSATPHIAIAEPLIKKAWKERGSGFSSTVNESQWNSFYSFIKQADHHLNTAQQLVNNDPVLYERLLRTTFLSKSETKIEPLEKFDVEQLKNLSRKEYQQKLDEYQKKSEVYYQKLEEVRKEKEKKIRTVLAKLVDIDPYYFSAFASFSHYYKTQWRRAGAFAEYLDYLVSLTEDQFGNAMYAIVSANSFREDQLFTDYGVEYEKLKQGMNDYFKLRPNDLTHKLKFAVMAARGKDHVLAQTLFKQVPEDSPVVKEYFRNLNTLKQWKDWADGKGPYPEESSLPELASTGNLNMLKRQIEGGADVNGTDSKGQTALYLAAWNGYVDIVKYLLEQGADPNICTGNNFCPINRAIYAQKGKHVEVLDLLLKHPSIDVNHFPAEKDPWTPLQSAIGWKKPASALKLLEHKDIDVNVLRSSGTTVLSLASNYRQYDVIDRLLDFDLDDLDSCSIKNCWQPLLILIWEKKYDLVKKMLEKGADPYVTTNDGRNAFDVAKQVKNAEIDALLMQYK